ncbi:MAG: glycoside hydrolase family 88 protein [Bacteroidales bacterium]|nr:MAG: glycoside hydrolase family 88 protein [Bacteroidales bacterium]
MYKLITLILVLSFGIASFAQKKDIDEAIVRSIADYILDHTTFTYVSRYPRQTYKSTKEIPENVEVRFTDQFTEWGYTMGVLNMAMVNLGAYLNEEKYTNYPVKHVANGMDNYKFFQKRFKNDRPHYRWPYGQLWTMKELDDCGAMGASVIEVYNLVRREDYREYIDKTARHIMEIQDRLSDGTLVRKFPHEMTLWADDLYMSVPFLARMGNLTGDDKYFDDALKQVFNFSKYLWHPGKELYYHCYYSDLERNGVAHWGRCNGWVMMAKVHLMNFLPEDYPQREDLRKNLEKQILGIAKYQNEDGLWHQVLDKTDSYLESSCSAMFVYSIARAVNEGWVDKRYASVALRGWRGLKDHKITHDGQLKDICVGTGIEDNLVFYYNRPARTNETHGLGAIIEAGIEILKLKGTIE